MSTALNIMTALAQPASPGAGSKSAATSGDSGSFNSLISTLTALSGQGETYGTSTSRSSASTANIDLGGLLSTSLPGETAEGLVNLLDGLIAGLEDTGSTMPADLLAGLNAAADGLLNLLQPAQGEAGASTQIPAGNLPQDMLVKLQSLIEKLGNLLPAAKGETQTTLTTQQTGVLDGETAAARNPAISGGGPQSAQPGTSGLDALLHKLQKVSEQLDLQLNQQNGAAAQQAAAKSAMDPATQTNPAKAAAAALTQQQGARQATAPQQGANGTATETPDEILAKAAGGNAAETDSGARKNSDSGSQIVSTAAGLAMARAGIHSNSDMPTDPILLAQTSSTNTRVDMMGAPKMGSAAYQSPAPQINLPNLAFQMTRQISQGNSRFQIQLDPPEMGRIDVKMDLDGNGGMQAKMMVERAETLELLQRDHRALERALQQAGLDGSKTSLEFSLKQNPFARQDGGQQDSSGFAGALNGEAGETEETGNQPINTTYYRGTASPGGVNLLA